MQVSALNLIIAAQQARNVSPPRPSDGPARTDNSSKPSQASAAGQFEPLPFEGQKASPSPPADGAQAAARFSPTAPVGSQIDIRV